jgi:hypothetical protein
MELGTGIFLSSALIALVLLYGFTKDRWPWRKKLGEMLRVGAIIILACVAVIAIAQFWEKWFPPQLERQTSQLERQTQYAGLRLGMSPQEVMYIKGYPPAVFGEESTEGWSKPIKPIKTDKLEKDKKVTDYTVWFYEQYKYSIGVVFNDKRTALTRIICHSDDGFDHCPSIASVSDGTSEWVVLHKL